MDIKALFKTKKGSKGSAPTVFHITHYKSGSQWILAVLSELAKKRVIEPSSASSHVTDQSIVSGGVYPCVYLTRPQFLELEPPENRKVFVVIRDLRDTLVSLYFSVRNSHQITSSAQQKLRDELRSNDIIDGLILLMEKRLHVSAQIQQTWMHSDDLLIRYEDVIKDEHAAFKKIISYCDIQVSDAELTGTIQRHSFENRVGRKPGEEDLNSHHRKGVSGDWKNYFDKKISSIFKEKFGDVLIETGYESNNDW